MGRSSCTHFNVGLEVEARTGFGVLHPWLASLYVAGNAGLVWSRVDLADDGIATSRERPLEGQSPWIANLRAGWDDALHGTRVA